MLDGLVALALLIFAFAEMLYFEPRRQTKMENARFNAAVAGFLMALDMADAIPKPTYIHDLHSYIKQERARCVEIKSPPENDPLWYRCNNRDLAEFIILCMKEFAQDYDLPNLMEYVQKHEIYARKIGFYYDLA